MEINEKTLAFLIDQELDCLCEEMFERDHEWCATHCTYSCPQRECWLRFLTRKEDA